MPRGSNQPVRLDGTDLALDSVDLRFALHLHGTFRPKSADGTLRRLMGALTADEQAQICTTGDLTWTADRTGGSIMPSGTGVADPEMGNDFAQLASLTAERSRR